MTADRQRLTAERIATLLDESTSQAARARAFHDAVADIDDLTARLAEKDAEIERLKRTAAFDLVEAAGNIDNERTRADQAEAALKAAIAGTVSEAMVEDAAKVMYELVPTYMSTGRNAERWTWEKASPDSKDYWRAKSRAALTAANFASGTRADGWKLIDTAPRDRMIIAGKIHGAKWVIDLTWWDRDGWYQMRQIPPTHWTEVPTYLLCRPTELPDPGPCDGGGAR